MIKKIIYSLSIIAATVHTGAYCGFIEGKGETAINFLQIDSSVKSSGMSGSIGATIEGIQSMFLNPAGLAAVSKTTVYALYSYWFADMKQGYSALGTPLNNNINFGLTLGYQSYPEMKAVEVDAGSVYGYSEGDSFNAYDGFIGVYLSKKFSKSVRSAVGVKAVTEVIGDYSSAMTAALDIGVTAMDINGAVYGFSVSNISWGADFGGGSEPLPVVLRIGGRWSSEHGQRSYSGKTIYEFSLGTEITAREGMSIKGGLEVIPVGFLSLRAGYTYDLEGNDLGGLGGAGIGFGFSNPFGKTDAFILEYSLSSFGRLGFGHRAGISFLI